jgi:glutamate synthase (NADPH/NADH) small chain
MGKATGFLEYNRVLPPKRDPQERKKDFKEIELSLDESGTKEQAARCMDCGVPFCHSGCPLGNIIPEFNDAVYQENWELAYNILSSTNNFPEFTGRICPAPCEASCVLGINKPAVTIEYIEKSIIETAFAKGLVKPQPPLRRTGKKVAVVGSGPAGLAAASQLNKAGHTVTVFERADAIGGLLRYGIPDFKLEKWVLDRRLKLMEEEGVIFRPSANVGVDIKVKKLLQDFDAVLMCCGSTVPRDLPVEGRDLNGVHFAMDFLTQQNKRVSGAEVPAEQAILATGKRVVVIGGGDTGSDCVGTSIRQGAASVTQIELMPMPPSQRTASMPWPSWPMILRTSTSHEEGCERQWAIHTKSFTGDTAGNLKSIKVADLNWSVAEPGKGLQFTEVPGTEREIPCDLVFLAMGFVGPEPNNVVKELNLLLDGKGNILCSSNYQSSHPKVFAAGDARRGQSLVVWAISEGREAARHVDIFMTGSSLLEAKEVSMLHAAPAF